VFVIPDCNGPWTADKINGGHVDVKRIGADIITISRLYIDLNMIAPTRVFHAWLNTTSIFQDNPSSLEWNCATDYDPPRGPHLGGVFIEIVNSDSSRRLIVDPLPGACQGDTESVNISAADRWSSKVHLHLATIQAFSVEGPGGEAFVLGNVTIDMFRIHAAGTSVQFAFDLVPLFAFLAGICLLIVAAVWIRDRRH
jgi:hypothetical protein